MDSKSLHETQRNDCSDMVVIEGAELQNDAGWRQILQDAYNFEVQRKPKWHVPLTLWTTEIGFFCNPFKVKKLYDHMEPTAINLRAEN